MKVTMEIFLHTMNYEWMKDKYEVFTSEVNDNPSYSFVCARKVEFDIPDGFSPVPAQVAALDKKIADAHAKCEVEVAGLKERKAKLLCLENGVTA